MIYLFLNVFLSNLRGIYKEQKVDVTIKTTGTLSPCVLSGGPGGPSEISTDTLFLKRCNKVF